MADVPLDLIISVGAVDEFKSLASGDIALTANSIGNRVIVSGQANVYRSVQTPPEASLVAGFGVCTLANGDSTNACLAFSSDWKTLHAKINAGGKLTIGYPAASTYSYIDKSSLASATQYDREANLVLLALGITPSASSHAVQLDTNLFAVVTATSFSGGNNIYLFAVQYDTTASTWRISTSRLVGTYGQAGSSGWAYARVIKGSTSKAVVVVNRRSSQSSGTDNYHGVDVGVYDITAGTSPSVPTTALVGSLQTVGQGRDLTTGPSWTLTNFATGSGAVGDDFEAVLANSTTLYISCANITTVSGGSTMPADSSTNWFSGVIKASINLSTGACTFTATYSWIAGVSRVGSRLSMDLIPTTTKAVIAGRRVDQSNKVQGAVFTGTAYGSTIDLMSHTGVTTVEDSIQIICPDVAKAIVAYRNATVSNHASHNRSAIRSISVTESSNTLTADGTAVEVVGGRRITRTKMVSLSTSSFAFAANYYDLDVLTSGLTAETVETYTFSGTAITLRSDMLPGPFIRVASGWGFIFPVDLGASPKKYAYLCSSFSPTNIIANHFYENGTGDILQMSDGSVMGGYARTS